MTTRTDGPDWFHGPVAPQPADGTPPAHLDDEVPVDDEPPVDDEAAGDDLLDDWAPPQRASRLTRVLAVAVLAAIVFTGGALVQKQFGSGTAAGAGVAFAGGRSGAFPGGGEGPAGFGGAGAPGQAGRAGQAGASGPAASGAPGASGASGASSAPSSAAATAPAVVGTVSSVSDGDLVVENFAQKTVTVHVPATATVTAPGLAGVAAGMTVTVVGTKAADGSITATSVVARTEAS